MAHGEWSDVRSELTISGDIGPSGEVIPRQKGLDSLYPRETIRVECYDMYHPLAARRTNHAMFRWNKIRYRAAGDVSDE